MQLQDMREITREVVVELGGRVKALKNAHGVARRAANAVPHALG